MTTAKCPPRILVFDSGVGSLSIGAEIHRRLEDVDLLYAMDRGGFPYGQWQEQPLVEHICKRVRELLEHQRVDILVMACNSASTTVLPALRAMLSIPVVGVVPAIKPAAQSSRSRVIGLLATPGTIQRPYTAQLIRDFAADCCVIQVGDGELAAAVEKLFWQGEDSPERWRAATGALSRHPRAAEMDTVVLACTHFPLVQQQLAATLPGINWIDSGAAIARRVEFLLGEMTVERRPTRCGLHQALILGETPSDRLQQQLAARGIALIH